MRRLGTALLAAALLLVGCADEGDDGDQPGSADPSVEVRRVVTSSQLDGGCRAGTVPCEAWEDFRCPGDPQELSDGLLMTCGAGDEEDQPYLLTAAEIVGGVASAEAVDRARIDQWEVEIELDTEGTARFADLTADLVPTSGQLAIVLDGTVVSAPAVQTIVTDGVIRLAGDYTRADAERLADQLAR